jgi:lysine 2,3-aminomutase
VSVGLEIMDRLRGHTSGLAIPAFVIDAPGGGGKIPLLPQYVLGRNGNQIILRNYKYDIFTYPDVEDEAKSPSPGVEKQFSRKKERAPKVYQPDKVQV